MCEPYNIEDVVVFEVIPFKGHPEFISILTVWSIL
jgi:hypothetical protein